MLNTLRQPRWWAFVLLVLVATAWFFVGSKSFQSCIQNAQTQAGGRATQEGISVLSGQIGIYRDCFDSFVIDNNAAITAVATVLLTIVTGGLVFVGYRQIVTTRAQLRAYVWAVPAIVDNKSLGAGKLRITFKISNAGATPAYQLTNSAVLIIERFPLRPNYPFPVLPSLEKSKSVLYPHTSVEGHAENQIAFTSDQMNEIAASTEKRVYIFGRIDYVDAFRDPRWAKFCMATVENPFVGTGEIRFQHSSQHNEAN